jgi:hypothetical protein
MVKREILDRRIIYVINNDGMGREKCGNTNTETNADLKVINKPYFEKAFYPEENSFPYYVITKIIEGQVEKANIEISNTKTENIDKNYNELVIIESGLIQTEIKQIGKQSIIQFLIPMYQKTSSVKEKIISFEYSFSYTLKSDDKKVLKTNFRSSKNSVMHTGKWYRIGVTSTGVQKLTYDFFIKNGVSVNDINPKKK